MKNVHTLLLLFPALFFAACNKVVGNGPVVSEERKLSGYEGIDLQVAGTVSFKQDSVYKVELRAQRNVLEEIQTYVSNDRLVIKLVHGIRLRSHKPLEVVVSGPVLRSLRVSGSGDINTTTTVATGNLKINVSGSGTISIAGIDAAFVDADISGAGSIKIFGGIVREEKLKISGSGNMELSDVVAQKAETTTSGSGDTRLQVYEELDVSISGSGSVFYKGNPLIHTHMSGSGTVVRQ